MRGKVEAAILAMERNGITPACAGKSDAKDCQDPRREDHPRVCGEKLLRPCRPHRARGSPPRVRGKVCNGIIIRVHHRITPACAGKSFDAGSGTGTHWDHPRVCGEKASQALHTGFRQGSPPRVRGKVCLNANQALALGITPACAGKSLLPLPSL